MSQLINFNPLYLPLLIFVGRIIDVTLGALRAVYVAKGEKYRASLLGFIEVFIWIAIISEIVTTANSVTSYIVYALGFAAGTFVGVLIEERLAIGSLLCRIYTNRDGEELVAIFNSENIGATLIKGSGSLGEVSIIETVLERKMLKRVDKIITQFDPDVFYITEDIRTRQSGIFPEKRGALSRKRPGK